MLAYVFPQPIAKAERLKSKVPNAHKARAMDAKTRGAQRRLGTSLANALRKFRNSISVSALAQRWDSGDWDRIDQEIPWDNLHKHIADPKSHLHDLIMGAAALAISNLDLHPKAASQLTTQVISGPKLRDYASNRVGEKIVHAITTEGRTHLRELVGRHMEHGLAPKEIASDIRDSIGLGPRYARAVQNFKKKMRDDGLPPEVVEKRGASYADRLLDSRAKTIARTETRMAANRAQRQAWRDAADNGLVDKQTAKRVWVVDGAPCEICEPMDGQETSIDVPFVSQEGEQVEPGEVHPNCGCLEILET